MILFHNKIRFIIQKSGFNNPKITNKTVIFTPLDDEHNDCFWKATFRFISTSKEL